MPQKAFTLRDAPIVIETAHGLIKITRAARGSRGRQILLELPEGLKAHIGVDAASKNARWLDFSKGSKEVNPKHSMLRSVKNGSGLVLRPVREPRIQIRPTVLSLS